MAGTDLDAYAPFARRRPAWWADAACRDRPDINWFPERGEAAEPAKAICAGCSVQVACLAFAIEEHIDHGIFGGLSARQRRKGRAGTVRQPKPHPAGAGRWRNKLDVDAARAKRAG